MRATVALLAAMGATACMTAPGASPRVGSDRIGLQTVPDTCGASSHAQLLGRSIDEVRQRPAIGNTRIATDDGPITADFSPQRLNIFFNEQTRQIVGIRCG